MDQESADNENCMSKWSKILGSSQIIAQNSGTGDSCGWRLLDVLPKTYWGFSPELLLNSLMEQNIDNANVIVE